MKFVLAPLADFTDAPFRRLAFECGADVSCTEMVSAAALAHGHSPTHQLLETMPGEGPVVCQLFAASEGDLAVAVRETAGHGFVALDLNAGCPMPNVTRCGAGAKLMEDPKKIGRLLRVMKENTDLPVTLKTRIGPHPGNSGIFEILDEAVSAGVSGIAVHARYTSQKHGGPIHLDVLREVAERSPVPVTGNGGVRTIADARAMAETGVSAIMVGRGALGNPGIFAELKRGLGLPSDRAAGESTGRIELCRRHLEYILAFREQLLKKFSSDHVPSVDGYASVKMHTHLFRYFSGLPGAAALRARLNSIRTLAEIREAMSSVA